MTAQTVGDLRRKLQGLPDDIDLCFWIEKEVDGKSVGFKLEPTDLNLMEQDGQYSQCDLTFDGMANSSFVLLDQRT